jgi:hypothetical protein
MIKPEFWEDEKVGQLSPMARLLFIAALNFADDEGFIRWNEDYISASVFPYDKLSDNKTKRLMKELENLQILEVFETKFHFFIAKILNFKRHQKISKPQASKFLQEYESHILKNQSKVENVSGKGSGNNSWNEFSQKEVKGSKEKEKKEKLKEEKGSENGKGTEKGKTDFSFVERPETTNDNGLNGKEEQTGRGENDITGNGIGTGTTMSEERKSQETTSQGTEEGENAFVKASESPPKETTSQANSWGSGIISSTSANTFKERVEYAKSLGVEEVVARRLCNFAQSRKIALCEMHYKGFVGKSGKEVEEAFNLLSLIAKRSRSSNGLKRINSG